MDKKGKIKIKSNPNINLVSHKILEQDYPIFCFKDLNTDTFKKSQDFHFFIEFLTRLNKLSILGWKEIRKADRHGFGMEKIPKEKIKQSLPSCITPEVKDLFVFRATGNNLPFIGIQIDKVFKILFIETKFGDVYVH